MQSSTEPVLLQQQIAFETVQPGIGKELFPLIGPGGPARQNFDDQAGRVAEISLTDAPLKSLAAYQPSKVKPVFVGVGSTAPLP